MKISLKIFFISLISFFSLQANGKVLLRAKPTSGGGLEIVLDEEVALGASHNTRQALSHELLVSPQNVLISNAKIRKLLENQTLINADFFYKKSKKYPLGFLNECQGYDCRVNRIKFPSYRNNFEDGVVKSTILSWPDKQETLVYTSFGSGGLLSDTVLINKLADRGYKKIAIHLIDYYYSKLIPILVEENNCVATDQIFDEEYSAKGYWTRIQVYRLTQMLNWFKQEGVTCTLYIYPDVQIYKKDCDIEQGHKAHLLIGMDFIDELTNKDEVFSGIEFLATCVRRNGMIGLLYDTHFVPNHDTRFFTYLKNMFPVICLKKRIADVATAQNNREANFRDITPFTLGWGRFLYPFFSKKS